MKLQYITDDNGEITGVFIPIKEWNDLKSRFKDISTESLEIPEWHKKIVRERVEFYKSNLNQVQDIHSALDEIEKEL